MRTEIPQHQREAGVGFFEHLPREVIAGVTFNQEMQEGVSDPKLLRWFDEDFLIRNAALFALGGIQGDPRLQTPTSHRGVILKKDTFFEDEHGMIHGEIGVKGTGITHNGIRYFNGEEGSKYLPLGFFGLKHSDLEMKLSNEFAELNGRGGRVIASIALDPKRLRTWAGDHKEGRDYRYNFFEMLDFVEGNNDTPALCVRLMGTDRVEDYKKARGAGFYTQEKMLVRAAKLMLEQIDSLGKDGFLSRYRLQEYFDFEGGLVETILRGGNYKSGDVEGLKSLAFLQRYFLYWNLAHVRKLSEQKYHGTLTYKGSSQDIDMLGTFYDWETSKWTDSQYYPESESGDHRAIRSQAKFYIPGREAHLEVSSLVFDAARMAGVVR